MMNKVLNTRKQCKLCKRDFGSNLFYEWSYDYCSEICYIRKICREEIMIFKSKEKQS